MTDDERKISEIKQRVESSICPTFDGLEERIEGRISKDDFDYLLASHTSWKIVAKHSTQLAGLSTLEENKVLQDALQDCANDWLKALDELDILKGHNNGRRKDN